MQIEFLKNLFFHQFDLIYWVVETPGVNLRLLKKIILEIEIPKGGRPKQIVTITEDGITEEDEY